MAEPSKGRGPYVFKVTFAASNGPGGTTHCRDHDIGIQNQSHIVFVTAVIAMAEPVESHFLWRPQLRDPGDEMALEAAVNGRADAPVTFNMRDYGDAPKCFGIELLLPRMAIGRIRQ